jgi:hypothetical protein
MSEQAPKRRRFHFGLRTLFVVVAVFGCWLGWQIHVVRSRYGFLRHMKHDRVPGMTYNTGNHEEVPIWRRWMGDYGIIDMHVPIDATAEEGATAKSLFPEVSNMSRGDYP